MKIYGSIRELVKLWFRKDNQEIGVEPNQAVTYTASRSYQLPPQDASSVLVSETATQTLTNKTLNSPVINGGSVSFSALTVPDAGLTIQDDVDPTKQAKFQASGITAGQTRTYTLPDASSTLVDLVSAQTLSNKTLTSPVINSPTGITKADVGLGNVDNTSDATKNAAAATLTNKTISGLNNTITDLGIASLGSFTSAQLMNALTDETGSGAAVFAANPVLTAPALGTPSSVVLTNATGLPLATGVNTFTSADLLGRLTDETGTGLAVFNASPTISNPVLSTGATLTEIATPATPSAGSLRVYAKTDDRLYTLNSAGVETQVGSGASSGGINYISNADFEATANGVQPANWSLYNDGASPTPVDGTGGTPAGVTFLASNSSPLRGNISAVFSKDAANRQGNGVSYPFSISAVDQNKKLAIRVDLQVSSGTYAQGDLAFYVYDVTNAVLITPNVAAIPASTTASHWEISWDSRASSSYRLIMHVASTSASAYSLKVDTFSVDPGVLGQLPPVGPVTTTATWTNIATVADSSGLMYDRVGEYLHINGIVTFSGTASGASNVTVTFANLTPIGSTSGVIRAEQQTTNYAFTYEARVSGSGLIFVSQNIGSVASLALTGNSIGSNASGNFNIFRFHNVKVRIAEWAGSGTVNMGASAQPTYASNSSTSTANDTTSFAYGEDGALVQAFAPSGNTAVSKRVRSLYPNPKFQIIQFKQLGRQWVNLPESGIIRTTNDAGTVTYGASLLAISGSTTDFDVLFYSMTDAITGDTWAAQNAAGTRWRVVFADTPAAVGFGLASATDSGLVNPYNPGSGVVYAGVYTPTQLASSNVSATTYRQANYIRVGPIVTVTGMVTITPTTTNTDTSITISLPVATANFPDAFQASGVCNTNNSANNAKDAGVVASVSGAQSVILNIENIAIGSGTPGGLSFVFSYEIQ